jgi:hypothetical protein
MAYVPVPKDLSKVKTKVAFNLTKRQLICFASAAAVGVPMYFLARGALGNSVAVLGMIAVMLPFFFFAMYEKDGLNAEHILRNFVRAKLWPGVRPYKTENLYKYLEEEAKNIGEKETTNTAAKVSAKKRGKRKKR